MFTKNDCGQVAQKSKDVNDVAINMWSEWFRDRNVEHMKTYCPRKAVFWPVDLGIILFISHWPIDNLQVLLKSLYLVDHRT